MKPFIYVPSYTTLTFDEALDAIAFEQRDVTVFGKTHPQPRLTAWYGPVAYTYSGLTWAPAPMPDPLRGLSERFEEEYGELATTVLANLYRDGSDRMGWHRDDEAIFGGDPWIASISLGETRTFRMRTRDRSSAHDIELEHGSLLIMPRGIQRLWEHCVPPRKKRPGARINLTFRTLG